MTTFIKEFYDDDERVNDDKLHTLCWWCETPAAGSTHDIVTTNIRIWQDTVWRLIWRVILSTICNMLATPLRWHQLTIVRTIQCINSVAMTISACWTLSAAAISYTQQHRSLTALHTHLWQGLFQTFKNLLQISQWQISTFLPRCMQCRCGLAMRILSVCPSVCPSHACIMTKRYKDLLRFIHHTKEHLS